METVGIVTSVESSSEEEFMNKMIKLIGGGNQEDVKLAINIIFAKYPQIRYYAKPYGKDKEVVDYKDILHIIPWADKIDTRGMLTPESITN